MTPTIRTATREDLPAIHALVGELAEFEKAPHEFIADMACYERNFDEGVFEALVAELDGQVAGMALYYLTFSTWKGRMLYLEDFVVRQQWRGNGLGQALFDAFLARARELDCRLVKWQVLDWNVDAIRFYERQQALIEREWYNGKLFLETDAR
jgi:GNAT superfamily N-acetyltransferase